MKTSPMMTSLTMSLMILGSVVAIAQQPNEMPALKIGMAKTFFKDTPKVVVAFVGSDFKEVLKQTTGLQGELVSDHGPAALASKMSKKELAFGIFHGHEFAKIRKQFPDFRPLVIAQSKAAAHAYVVVHKNNTAQKVEDLRGKSIVLPLGSMDHSRLFLEHLAKNQDRTVMEPFFKTIKGTMTQAAALDQLARGKIEATVVDAGELGSYKDIKGPVFAAHLRVLTTSSDFPPPVVVYQEGSVNDQTLKQMRDGLLEAHKNKQGREMMKEWTVEMFARIPMQYSESLDAILMTYPITIERR